MSSTHPLSSQTVHKPPWDKGHRRGRVVFGGLYTCKKDCFVFYYHLLLSEERVD